MIKPHQRESGGERDRERAGEKVTIFTMTASQKPSPPPALYSAFYSFLKRRHGGLSMIKDQRDQGMENERQTREEGQDGEI